MIATGASWDAFRDRLEKFRYDAPLGAYKKLDHQIEQVKSRRGSTADVVGLRKGLWRAAFFSAAKEDHRLSTLTFRDEAAKYLDHLEHARAALIQASHVKIDDLFRALKFVPDNSADLKQRLSRQMVEQEFYRLNDALGETCRQLDRYLQRNVLPPKRMNGANNSDHFLRAFIEGSTLVWQEGFGAKPTSGDYADYVSVLATAIDEFGYPRTDEQKLNDDWLKDRVRKQLFGKKYQS